MLAGRALFPDPVGGRGPGGPAPHASAACRPRCWPPPTANWPTCLRSGVPLLRSLEVLRKQTSHAGLKSVLGEVHRQVEDGASLADAMGHFQAVFGEMAVSMVRAGGEGGFLEEALARVAEFTEAQDDLKKRTAGAVAYPAFLAVVGTIVVVVLMVFFVPKFGELFAPAAREERAARC